VTALSILMVFAPFVHPALYCRGYMRCQFKWKLEFRY